MVTTRSDAGWGRQSPPAPSHPRIVSPVACYADGYQIDSPCSFTRHMIGYDPSMSPTYGMRKQPRSFAQRLLALLRPESPRSSPCPPPYILYCDNDLPAYEDYRLPPYRQRETWTVGVAA
ncbi:hypothetical protein CcaverHIS002_0405890 [Cutaneotrichosporon cavernicola]|uniref:Uncharacterized protein n=1 Tax=Cutaneotrichosporon cavernicola TaxID=279322 RepID=A0AA48QVX9_9TREE|nr:uncharacterized protein CcaverHIS019_0405910 [Cutaneotrichosporon cavernicola]BEI83985.1 hypothetical protein CcaverHIS002_0405890 [Cutaneotrichosporon cavernicola]BEI91771.1 hypothetical protein CcaverHIS019_0405910 [Cutaneotrichosporon cavernicola]BEI99543.1 hypothetical protein CcaverHIS631_0405860 [Cutaneotrichosporon cavernicola]BEJ07320.1 hypothetical protein CcaverHIS641_0405890 [Cutaneotrichosporon cavernicola]